MGNKWAPPNTRESETLKEDRGGNPPRTRQCRLSDVAKLRPILYPEQAVSTVVRTLHLPSIPQEVSRLTQEHQQIAADHQQLLQQLTAVLETVDAYWVQFHREIQQQREVHRRQLHGLQEELTQQLHVAEERLAQVQQAQSNELAEAQEFLRTLGALHHEAVQAMQGEYAEMTHKVEVYRAKGQQA